ncbi:GGDEF domain-containing protein [Sulfurimonas sp. MAG313]|nr:GGDEF domain-containing protein [Sulfurimonas sp. MAG313]MDF1881417.1 GGDEF domain-containing protein [Sulfurimonas sp. MAG313]
MRWSIKKIFDNLSKTLLALSILLGLLAVLTFTLNSSVEKTELILDQKTLMVEAYNLGREDIELSNIQLKGIVSSLKFDIVKMKEAFEFDILGQYLYGHSTQYVNDLEELEIKQLLYIEAATDYYTQSLEDLEERLDEFDFAQVTYTSKLAELQEKHMIYEAQKFQAIQILIYLIFLISILATLWFTRRLSYIYKDIKTLYSVDLESKGRMFQTEEAEMITKRMSRKPTATENPAFVDPVTEINNYKGLLHGFANRKGSNGATLIVCVFSLDHFKDVEKKYKKDLANQILKKIAFTFSLYEQHTDVLGRIDYDQFVLILNRTTKDAALHDCEQIRKTIEETRFKAPKGESISVTVSGGFVVKAPNKALDQTIAHAKEILHAAIAQGGNRIAQLRDRAEKGLR